MEFCIPGFAPVILSFVNLFVGKSISSWGMRRKRICSILSSLNLESYLRDLVVREKP